MPSIRGSIDKSRRHESQEGGREEKKSGNDNDLEENFFENDLKDQISF
jgi:hypothetical protein